ncbi:MAG: DNA-3-methyladenine glycosylase [Phycisphaeraceae bacterium]|nr:DNA-3-methyladenine glycosylase [Phycisphaeraceae bacterium]
MSCAHGNCASDPGALRSRPVSRRFYARAADALAVALLGRTLVRVMGDGTRLAGRIVETEAYLGPEDRAAHCFGGRRTARNESMYGRPGTAYVYFTYGMHHCFNVVCGREGEPAAVLIRALDPVEGLGEMRRRRSARRGGVIRDTDLCSGPGRLCEAMGFDRGDDGVDLAGAGSRVFIVGPGAGGRADEEVVNTARIGVAYAGEWADRPLRWFVAGSPHVSRGGSRSGSRRSGGRSLR